MKIGNREVRYFVEYNCPDNDLSETRYYEHYRDYLEDRKANPLPRGTQEIIWCWAWDAMRQCWDWAKLDDEY